MINKSDDATDLLCELVALFFVSVLNFGSCLIL